MCLGFHVLLPSGIRIIQGILLDFALDERLLITMPFTFVNLDSRCGLLT